MEEPAYTMPRTMAILLALRQFFLLLNLVPWLLLGLPLFCNSVSASIFSRIDSDNALFFFFIVVVVVVLNLFEFNVRGFVRFVNIRDGKGATPLHLAARQRRPECVHILLDCGALVCASTGRYG